MLDPKEVVEVMNPSLWERSGGLIGLVIFALFIGLGLCSFLLVQMHEHSRVDIKELTQMKFEDHEHMNNMVRREFDALENLFKKECAK